MNEPSTSLCGQPCATGLQGLTRLKVSFSSKQMSHLTSECATLTKPQIKVDKAFHLGHTGRIRNVDFGVEQQLLWIDLSSYPKGLEEAPVSQNMTLFGSRVSAAR